MSAADAPWLLGASGQVGDALRQRLGNACVPCARAVPRWAADDAARWRCFDLWANGDAPTCERLISAGPLDAGVAWMERVGPGALRRIVALSSMSAVHKQASPARAEREIAQRLLDAERRLFAFAAKHAIACTILRPTLIWGAGMDHSLTPFAQAAARRGFALIPNGANGLRQPVHVADLALLCGALTHREESMPGQFEAGGGERLTLSEMLARTARSVDARVLPLPLPGIVLALAARVAARFGRDAGALARAMQAQCCRDDAIWGLAGLVPRGFAPVAADWRPRR
jgi:hypothetical protein